MNGIKKAIVITGMHRSGTSAITRALSFYGFKLPKNLLAPSKNNTLGHWESEIFYKLNNQILSDYKQSWDNFSKIPFDQQDKKYLSKHIELISKAINEEYPESNQIILKDPRFCKLLPLWTQALEYLCEDALYIIPLRHPVEVAVSLNKRNRMPVKYGLLLWLRYVLDSVCSCDDINKIFTSYDGLIEKPLDELNKIFESSFFNNVELDSNENVSSFISAEHKHNNYFELLDIVEKDRVYSYCIEVFDLLKGGRLTDSSIYDKERLNEIYRWLNKNTVIFAGLSCELLNSLKTQKRTEGEKQNNKQLEKERHNPSNNLELIINKNFSKLSSRIDEIEQKIVPSAQMEERLGNIENQLSKVVSEVSKIDKFQVALSRKLTNEIYNSISTVISLLGAQKKIIKDTKLYLYRELKGFTKFFDRLESQAENDFKKISKQVDKLLKNTGRSQTILSQSITDMIENNNQYCKDVSSQIAELESKFSEVQSKISVDMQKVEAVAGQQFPVANEKPSVKKYSINPAKVTESLRNNFLVGSFLKVIRPIRMLVRDQNVKNTILNSEHFDCEWYAKIFPELKGLKKEKLVSHYVSEGYKLNADPGPSFNGEAYIKEYPDVFKLGLNPLYHFEKFGKRERRKVYPSDMNLLDVIESNFSVGVYIEEHNQLHSSYQIKNKKEKSSFSDVEVVFCSLFGVDLGKLDGAFFVDVHELESVLGGVLNFSLLIKASDFIEFLISKGASSSILERYVPLSKAVYDSILDVYFIGSSCIRILFSNKLSNSFISEISFYSYNKNKECLSLLGVYCADGLKSLVCFDLVLENPFNPILFICKDDEGFIVDSSLFPFPSCIKNGFHSSEINISSGSGKFSNLYDVSNVYLNCAIELSDARAEEKLFSLNALSANGTELVFSGAYLTWLEDIWGIKYNFNSFFGDKNLSCFFSEKICRSKAGEEDIVAHSHNIYLSISAMLSLCLNGSDLFPNSFELVYIDNDRYSYLFSKVVNQEYLSQSKLFGILNSYQSEYGKDSSISSLFSEGLTPKLYFTVNTRKRSDAELLYPQIKGSINNIVDRVEKCTVFFRLTSEDLKSLKLSVYALMAQRFFCTDALSIFFICNSSQAGSLVELKSFLDDKNVVYQFHDVGSKSLRKEDLLSKFSFDSQEMVLFLTQDILMHNENTLNILSKHIQMKNVVCVSAPILKYSSSSKGAIELESSGYNIFKGLGGVPQVINSAIISSKGAMFSTAIDVVSFPDSRFFAVQGKNFYALLRDMDNEEILNIFVSGVFNLRREADMNVICNEVSVLSNNDTYEEETIPLQNLIINERSCLGDIMLSDQVVAK